MNYILLISRNGADPKPIEAGAKTRLKTYMEGIERGLIVAGYTRRLGFGNNRRLFHKGDETVNILLIDEDNFRKS